MTLVFYILVTGKAVSQAASVGRNPDLFLFFLMPCVFQSGNQEQRKEPVPWCWCFVPATYGEDGEWRSTG